MQHCLDPFFPPSDARPVLDRSFNRVMRSGVACGRCRCCVANRKNDWTGRLLAECTTSASVAFVTLTYKTDPQGRFEYRDVQLMLKSLRKAYAKKSNFIRYFVVGEFGTLKGRVHWHVLLFFSKPAKLRRMNPGELWKHWPHGWAAIEMLSDWNRAKKVRYCVKYCVKNSFADAQSEMHASLKPAIGDAFFRDLAERTAKAGLSPNGKYRHSGVTWSQGRKKGQLIDFSLTGASRRNFIQYYAEAWAAKYGDKPYPYTDWLRAFDPVAEARPVAPLGRLLESSLSIRDAVFSESKEPSFFDDAYGHVLFTGEEGVGAVLLASSDGRACVEFIAHGDKAMNAWIGKHPVRTSVNEVRSWPDGVAKRADSWLADIREGFDPEGFVDEEAEQEARAQRKARHKAAAERWAQETAQRAREKYGVPTAADAARNAEAFDRWERQRLKGLEGVKLHDPEAVVAACPVSGLVWHKWFTGPCPCGCGIFVPAIEEFEK